MVKENLILNSLSFDYPKEPVIFYFSQNDDEKHQSTIIKSYSLIPKEVRTHKKFLDFSSGTGSIPQLYTTFDLPCDNFESIPIDFNDPDNEYLIKRYYHHRLERYFRKIDNIVVTKSGITNDLQVWIRSNATQKVSYLNESFFLYQMEKFTLKVKYDSYNHHPYILVSSDRPSLLMGITLQKLTSLSSGNPLEPHSVITPSMINKVMVVKEKTYKEGKVYRERRIERLDYLQTNNIPYDSSHTFVIVSGEMKKLLGIDQTGATNTFESKYIKYFDKITEFKNKYLQPNALNHIFPNLASEFTRVSELQIGQTDNAKRVLLFGHNYKSYRPQDGINHGPAINSPHTDIQLIAIYHQDDKQYASNLLGYFRNGNYQNQEIDRRNPLSKYLGSTVNYAAQGLHIEFCDYNNPIPEISERLKKADYQNLNPKIEYVGIYVSPIYKYTNDKNAKECYYKIKELFLKHGIATQCVESEKMKSTIKRDNGKTYKNFTYTLQNMAVAICAKTGGSPWLLDTTTKRELVIGIGAFKSNNEQFIGAAFSFDNTGIFNKYNYFHKKQIDELVGAIRKSIIDFSASYERPEKIVIHYYKQISRKHEYERIENMLFSLNLDIPVYIVTINKTESEDVVVFDHSSNFEDKYNNKIKSLMPYSGRWVNLGKTKQGYRYLLCNNTRYEDAKFNKMDGFPFPIKLTIACPYNNDKIDLPVINLLLDQVYQFSRIYWKSVKQQGLPVTIKYPEMIAEIMPHFNNQAIYPKQNSLWFL